MLAAFPVITYMEPNDWWVIYSIVGVIFPLLLYFVAGKISKEICKW